jgi:hypothetical protein
MKSILCFLGTMLTSVSAFGVDGTVLINQSTVMALGGFPYTISNPGSYRLSGNLTVPNANTSAIVIATDYVTLDLNGFSILGPTVCSGASFVVTSCSPTGNGDGISGSLHNNITVMNGIVKGMGRFGVTLDGCQGCIVERMIISHSGSIGIFTGRGRVSDNSSMFNGVRGIQNASGPMINNYAGGNAGYGIIANCPGSVIGNVTEFNGGPQQLLINGASCAAATNASAP